MFSYNLRWIKLLHLWKCPGQTQWNAFQVCMPGLPICGKSASRLQRWGWGIVIWLVSNFKQYFYVLANVMEWQCKFIFKTEHKSWKVYACDSVMWSLLVPLGGAVQPLCLQGCCWEAVHEECRCGRVLRAFLKWFIFNPACYNLYH